METSSQYSRDTGLERALQHIEEAKQLSRELGGSDQEVKGYFFSLPSERLHVILNEYERQYGALAREYAEETLPKWRSGRVHMSGMVATRLFKLLPPRMPPAEKYKLTENLWRHVGPSSRKTLRVGLNAEIEDIVASVRSHIEGVVVSYNIPETLERRFEWLSAGDVHVKQDLLNHLRQMEKSLVVGGAREQLPVMLSHLRREEGHYTHRLAQVLKIGKHELEILMDKTASGVRLEEPSAISTGASVTDSTDTGSGWLWWLVIGGAILFFLAQ